MLQGKTRINLQKVQPLHCRNRHLVLIASEKAWDELAAVFPFHRRQLILQYVCKSSDYPTHLAISPSTARQMFTKQLKYLFYRT